MDAVSHFTERRVMLARMRNPCLKGVSAVRAETMSMTWGTVGVAVVCSMGEASPGP